MSVLAVVDADKIHEYVFGPHELRMVRGGSVLEWVLNEEELPGLVKKHGGDKVYAGGGTTLATFDDSDSAMAFRREAEKRYADLTVVATATSAQVEVGDRPFPEANELLHVQLELRKAARLERSRPASNPFSERCAACGQQPAAAPDPEPKRERRLCQACQQRLQFSGRASLLPPDRLPAEDLTKVGQLARPDGYLATVYLDLDRAGSFLRREGNTLDAYSRLSKTMRDSVRGAVHAALEAAVPTERDGVVGYEVFLIGGDDALVAVPADRFFVFLRAFQEKYHAAWAGSAHPSFSCGALLAHDKTPIVAVFRQAEEFLRSAKRMKNSDDAGLDPDNDTVDYAISAAAVEDLLGERRAVEERGGGQPRTMKPYKLREVLELAAGVAELRRAGAPANKIRQLYDIAYESRTQADLDYLFVLSRLDGGYRTALRRLVEGGELSQTIWRRVRPDAAIATNLADIAELWEFCR